jgi:hypothetical protein
MGQLLLAMALEFTSPTPRGPCAPGHTVTWPDRTTMSERRCGPRSRRGRNRWDRLNLRPEGAALEILTVPKGRI